MPSRRWRLGRPVVCWRCKQSVGTLRAVGNGEYEHDKCPVVKVSRRKVSDLVVPRPKIAVMKRRLPPEFKGM